jgi:uncharacterized protein YdeI (YjbR/CyaY-like superfamily)
MQPRYFRTPADLRAWLARHHASATELLVGFHRRESGEPGITWPESVDEALCYGWIDGVRRRIDAVRYSIRFTPRSRGSVWSAANIRRVGELVAAGRLQPAGQTAFDARRANRSGVYAYEQRPSELAAPYAALLAENRAARRFFAAQPPSYRRAATWWVLSAKREATRLRRTATLIELSAAGKWIPQFLRSPPRSGGGRQRRS